jgi:glyoxylase-like metal-dependent hydrolase (beta-lactamase superfamily II)
MTFRVLFACVASLAIALIPGTSRGDGPFPPHKIADNTYYVGSQDLATYLVTTPEGHILINSGFEETVPLIRDAVQTLGFKPTDVKFILASHAHSDHVAGHARLKELTGAQVLVMEGDEGVIRKGGEGQYLYTDQRWLPCPVDRVLKDREKVTLGGVALTAHRTAGHTPGCTTWTWRTSDRGRPLDVVVIGSPNMNPGYQLVGNTVYPAIASDYAATFRRLKSLPCDIFLGAHGDYYKLPAKHARLKSVDENPFIDPQGYADYVAFKEKAFRDELARQGGTVSEPAVRHSFFIAGPTFTGIIGEEGEELWNAGQPAARDGYVLPNGNVLIAWGDEVRELTREKEVVFRYRKSEGNAELGTVQRLANGNTLITELGARPRLLEVTPKGELAVDCPLLPETDNAHMQTRMARRLPNGNYLAPHLLAFKVKEYTPQGKVVQEFATDLPELGGRPAENWPFTAIRLKNGHTLVNLTHGNKTVEFDPQGKVVWKVGNDDFPEVKPFADPCGGQRLPNGNTVIASYGTQGAIKVFEVNREKQIVWKYTGPHRAHEIQVLTTNGEPIEGDPLK